VQRKVNKNRGVKFKKKVQPWLKTCRRLKNETERRVNHRLKHKAKGKNKSKRRKFKDLQIRLKIYDRIQEKVEGRGDNRKVKFKQYSPMYLRTYENSNDIAEGRKLKYRKWKFKGIHQIWLKAHHRLKANQRKHYRKKGTQKKGYIRKGNPSR
jgi:hypothetical protein